MPGERTFVDAAGVQWRVFEEQSAASAAAAGGAAGAVGTKPDRCLIFEARNERRFMCPPPFGWESAPDDQIAALCERAETEDVGTQDDLERPT
jgi:hypothetical protein